MVRLPWNGMTTMATSASAETARAMTGRAECPTGLWERHVRTNVPLCYESATLLSASRDSHAAGPCALQTDPAPGAKDEVVHDLDSEQAASRHGVSRRPQVVGGRRRIAGGVVVRQEDPRGVAPHSLGEELRDAHRRAGDVADVDRNDRDEAVLSR